MNQKIDAVRTTTTTSPLAACQPDDAHRNEKKSPTSNERVEILTEAECRELVDRHHFGRFAFVDYVGVLPSIIPVNYLLDDDKIVIRTDAGSKLSAALRGAPVAFEVDGVDETRQVGWSVVVRGRAEEVADEDQLAELRQTPLLAWHPGPVARYVRINASQVIGRRIKIADIHPDWWG
jgi:nitroimidazol reductase NimA-like FMN-containing flavoprotein (pyridoxamine 5'-phosphate oxidase superfamily)